MRFSYFVVDDFKGSTEHKSQFDNCFSQIQITALCFVLESKVKK